MLVCEQEYEDGVSQATRVNFLGGRGIEAVLAIDHARGNQATLSWLLYDGHGNLARLMAPNYTLSGFQWCGVWGEVQNSLGVGRGYCANLGHPEDETGLVYMRARYYEPATGRFISEDPARDGVNRYLYADGNPVNKVDADGQSARAELLMLTGALLKALGSILLGISPLIAFLSVPGMVDEMIEAVGEYMAVKKLMEYLGTGKKVSPLQEFKDELRYLIDCLRYKENFNAARRYFIDAPLTALVGYLLYIEGEILQTEAAFEGGF
jgi:RHS repeat-associated protein